MFGRNLRSRYFWRRLEDEVVSELDFHVEMRAREYMRRGMDADAAHELARRRFGNLKEVERTCAGLALETERAHHRLQWLDELLQDSRYAVRQLARQPLFTLIAVATLAIGIGANTAIFSVLNTVYFRPLPFRDADRLVRISQYTVGPDGTHRRTSTSGFALEAVLERGSSFEDALGQRVDSVSLESGTGPPERVSLVSVSPRWADILGVGPVVGRTFSPDEEARGIDSGVTMLSYSLAVRTFGSAGAGLGEAVTVAGRSLSVVGILPAGFHYPYEADLWAPFRFGRDDRRLNVTARLRPGATLETANRELSEVAEHLAVAPAHRGTGLEGRPVRETLIDGEARVATALMAAVAFVLLIACANLATLLTTRYVGRQQEVAIRAALGGGRWRQLRQFVTESVLIFALGASAGLVLMTWLRGYLNALIPEDLRRQLLLSEVAVDWRVAAFTAGIALATGVVFGAVAALRASRIEAAAVLRAGRSSDGRGSRRTLECLAAAEIALAIALLTSAALMAKSFQQLQRRDLGFDYSGILTLQTDLTGPRYTDGGQRLGYIERARTRIAALPGVSAVGLTTDNPLCCGDWSARVIPEGLPIANDQAAPMVAHRLVTPGFFEALGVRLLRGRYFTDADDAASLPVVIVDERMANHLWPGVDPIGRRIKRGPIASTYPWLTVVGVVSSVRMEGDYEDTWFLPYAQHALGPSAETQYWMIRAEGDPLALAPAVRKAMADADPAVAQAELTTMAQLWIDNIAQDRLGAFVVALFAGFGLLLAGLGVYGVMAYTVRQREKEIGVRIALGAGSRRILVEVLGRAVRIAACGCVLGFAGAALAGRILNSLLVDVAVLDAFVAAGSAATLGLISLAATALPARRAARIDPIQTLRA